jgi:hypothetical protein
MLFMPLAIGLVAVLQELFNLANNVISNKLVDRLRHLVPAMSLSADSNGGQAATIGWESSEPVAPLDSVSVHDGEQE